ncbi:MAG: threonine ammonia-lyase, biosynthetic [Gammaproteobacteria bacterium]|nr:threonine ammonia-lyase, biosynthetic [Gammaproteobacteria bacterium]
MSKKISKKTIDTYVKKILQAHIYDLVDKVPLEKANCLSSRWKNNIYLKREDLQSVFSFKIRGAYNKILQLSEKQKEKGLIAASAGNHAQGVALSASTLGINSLIIMPKTTPDIKINAVKSMGSEVKLVGNSYDEAYEYAKSAAIETGREFIHPYDDPDVIAGQGTIAMEIMEQSKILPDAIFVPVGGGGLIAGISVYIKFLYPHIKIIGVEPDDAGCLYEALKHQQRVILDQVGIFADGVAVKQVGKETFKLAREFVDEVILVSADEICAAIKDIFDDTRSITEPAGALAIAGLKKYVQQYNIKDQDFVAIASGANMNFDRLRHVTERAEIGENREVIFAAVIDEKPGSFQQFSKIIGQRSITEFNYRYGDPKCAQVFVGVKVSHHDEKIEMFERLRHADYDFTDMSDNELAKLHIRYMVGGKARKVANERLFRFQFPERPGALLHFLNKIGKRWNISLFHYRNHGSAFGRILTGIQVPKKDNEQFECYLNELNYPFWEETENIAYQKFLSS